jgi:hypothetical protein
MLWSSSAQAAPDMVAAARAARRPPMPRFAPDMAAAAPVASVGAPTSRAASRACHVCARRKRIAVNARREASAPLESPRPTRRIQAIRYPAAHGSASSPLNRTPSSSLPLRLASAPNRSYFASCLLRIALAPPRAYSEWRCGRGGGGGGSRTGIREAAAVAHGSSSGGEMALGRR